MTNIQKISFYQRPVWIGELFKVNGQYTDKPVHFSIRRLESRDSSAMGDLSANIYEHLRFGEECYIHKHPKEYYNSVFNDEDIHYIGIFADKKLIGMSYMRICRDTQAFYDEIPNSPIDFFNHRQQLKIAALGADSVLPEYRGNKLNQIMISYRLELAASLGCSEAASIVDRSNHWNMPPYFNNGFNMYATAIDPRDGGKIALMHHRLKDSPQNPPSRHYAVSYQQFDKIDKLLKKGFVGVGYNNQTGEILFAPKETLKTAHLPPKRVSHFSNNPLLSIMQSYQVQRV